MYPKIGGWSSGLPVMKIGPLCIEDTEINNLASALLGGSPGHSNWSGADCKGTYIYAGPLPMDGGKEAVELAIVG